MTTSPRELATGSTDVPRGAEQTAGAARPVGTSTADAPDSGPLGHLARFGVRPLLLGLDLVAVLVGLVGTEWFGREVGDDSPLRKTIAFAVFFLLALAQAGLYRSRLALSALDDLPVLAGRWTLAAGLAVLAQVVWSRALWQDYIINWRFLWGAVTIGVLVIVLRAVGYALVRRLRSRRLVVHRTLIVGAGRVGHQVADILQQHPEYGLHPVGFLDADPRYLAGEAGLPVLGTPADLTEELRDGLVHNVVVAFSSMKESEMVRLIRTCDRYRCELFVVPRLFELHHVDDDMDTAWGLPLVRLRRSTYRSPAWRVKRLFDLAVAGGAVTVLAPLLALIALAVRLDSGPGVLFRQERVGVDGRTFQVLKFRSMRATATESATTWNIAKDPRVTRVGRFLRKTSLDELPQLFNIVRGDMSIVGPRPERPHFVDEFRSAYPSYEARHRVPSGLTGWAQVHGLRGDTSIADRARFDNYYIENWSLWLDLKIILRTFSSVLRGAGG
ncbi:exopolysaccharide biosynthesis polyprenyl glycosylphosphotransferase [Geodermatophilus sp. SYSU D01106]